MGEKQYNLRLNRAKSAEIIFTNCKRKLAEDPPPQMPDVHRVTSIKVLDVTMTKHLSVGKHVRDVVGKRAQSLHALKLLRHHGMSDDSFRHVYKAVVLSKPRLGGVSPTRPINVLKHLCDVLSGSACTPPTIPRCLNWLLTWTITFSRTYATTLTMFYTNFFLTKLIIAIISGLVVTLCH